MSEGSTQRWLAKALESAHEEGFVKNVEEVTFREFLQWIGAQDPRKINAHVRPQYEFLKGKRIDKIIKLEELDDEAEFFKDKLGEDLKSTKKLATSYSEIEGSGFADMPLGELKKLKKSPPPECFYSKDIKDLFLAVYGRDLDELNYELPDTVDL